MSFKLSSVIGLYLAFFVCILYYFNFYCKFLFLVGNVQILYQIIIPVFLNDILYFTVFCKVECDIAIFYCIFIRFLNIGG